MADITRERTGELLRHLFEIVMAQPDGLQAKVALAALAKRVKLTPHEAGAYEKGGRRFEKIVRFATVDTVKAGWLVKAKGYWTVTDAGRQAYARFSDPADFYREAVRLYRAWRSTQPNDGDAEADGPAADSVSEREVTSTFEEAEERAWQEVESFITQMAPYDFQDLVAGLIRGMGYHVAWIAPPGKDGGIDILAFNDPLGTRPPRMKVQVKRQQQPVSVDGVRSFLAVLGNDDVGVFVNTGGFTRDAKDAVRNQMTRHMTLIDIERLFDLWIEHYPRLDEVARRRMPLKPIYFLAPSE
jgi:restriction system protein